MYYMFYLFYLFYLRKFHAWQKRGGWIQLQWLTLKPPKQQTAEKTIPDYPYNQNKMIVQPQTKKKMKIHFFTDLLNATKISSGSQQSSFLLIMFYNVLKSIIKSHNRSLLTYCFVRTVSSSFSFFSPLNLSIAHRIVKYSPIW